MTIKDIAQLSGYGIGTVSRVLNNHPDVSEKARQHILKVIEETGFQPNSNAKHLKLRASSSISIIVKGTHNVLFADIVEQIQTRLLENGEDTAVSYLDEDANEVHFAIQLCRDKNPKGIIFLGGNLEYFKNDFPQISVPCVLLTNSSQKYNFPNLSSLTTDDGAAAKRVIDYLVIQGHENIGVLGGNASDFQVSGKRIDGCRHGFQKHNLSFDSDVQYEPCRYSMEDGYIAAKKLLKKNTDLTAIFALSDVIALGAIRAIYDMGKRIPEDISIVGYDGIPLSRYCFPRLTTIQQNTKQLADQGVDLILQRIHYPYQAVHKIVPFELLEGESVRPLSNS